MNPRPLVAEQFDSFRALRAPFVAFSAILVALLLIPNPLLMPSSSRYSPLVSLFIEGIKRPGPPGGWVLFSMQTTSPLEIYEAASVTLALLISSPTIAFQIMKFIGPALATRRRMLYSLVALASVLLAVGALFGDLFLAPYLIAASFNRGAGDTLLLETGYYYFLALEAILAGAAAFTLPVYIYALVRFRVFRTK